MTRLIFSIVVFRMTIKICMKRSKIGKYLKGILLTKCSLVVVLGRNKACTGGRSPRHFAPDPWQRVQGPWWDPRRPCAGVDDGRSGLLLRPIAAFSSSFFRSKLVPSNRLDLVPL